MNQYQDYIHLSRYARWIESKGRRETWNETVQRYFDFFGQHLVDKQYIDANEYNLVRTKLEQSVVDGLNMPSMRAMATAGEALRRCNVAAYNCAASLANYKRFFAENFYILLSGTGTGGSVERQFITSLESIKPFVSDGLAKIPENFKKSKTIVVRDSKRGWAEAYEQLIDDLFNGFIPEFDISGVRPAGARLKTFGGRSSGGGVLLLTRLKTIEVFMKASGRKLTSVEIADIFCYIAAVVVVGGVRRAALIILSNLSDLRMQQFKTGDWRTNNPQREMANISTCYTEKPDILAFMEEFINIYKSFSGERGIFNRQACSKKAKENGRRKTDGIDFVCNPCSEIILRPKQMCNLSEVITRYDDDVKSLSEKAVNATILGTWQSTLTDFKFLSPEWKENCEEERLLGVSITGIMDNPILNNVHPELPAILTNLKNRTIETNKEWAAKFGINQSTAITCIKPSGTVSELMGTSSGIHPRHSEYYIRNVSGDIKDPLTHFLINQGVQHQEKQGSSNIILFAFPIKSPETSILRRDLTAIQHLELWYTYYKYWCEHKPSVTINVRDHEWLDVGAWCYEHFDDLSGVALLPYSDHHYPQTPFEECDKQTYENLVEQTPEIDWTQFNEDDDNTTSSQELACTSATGCSI